MLEASRYVFIQEMKTQMKCYRVRTHFSTNRNLNSGTEIIINNKYDIFYLWPLDMYNESVTSPTADSGVVSLIPAPYLHWN